MYHFLAPPHPVLPPVERYIRRSVVLASGASCEVGIEHRDADDVSLLSRNLRDWAALAGGVHQEDYVALGNAWSSYAIINYPDRYWFCEVWGPDSDKAFYQVIQPPAGGTGMRR